MPRLYLDCDDGERVTRDDVGQDLSGQHEVRRAALQLLRDTALGAILTRCVRTLKVSVRDEDGAEVYVATISMEQFSSN